MNPVSNLERVEVLINHYEKLSGNCVTNEDSKLIEQIATLPVSINDLADSLTECFSKYQPNNSLSKIRTFAFCNSYLHAKFLNKIKSNDLICK